MKIYKGLVNVPDEMTCEHRSAEMDKKIKIIGLPFDEFIKRYKFISKRTLRGYLIEFINIAIIGLVLYVVGIMSLLCFMAEYYGYATVNIILWFYLMFSKTIFYTRETYNLNHAEYYIDIERRK